MGASILICEDEKDIVTTLEYNLQKDGFETLSVGTATAALQALQSGPLPDLLLLDLMLPDLSGI